VAGFETPGSQGSAGDAELVAAARAGNMEAFACLADRHRGMVAALAFYWQGLTHAEAALELGITVGAVKARLHQARGALAPQLAARTEHEKEVPAMPTAAEPVWVNAEVIDVCRSDSPDDPLYRPHVVVLQERGRWERYPARVPDLAAEARGRRASVLARLTQEHESPEQPGPA
jgi:Sigma-70, region 4